jgi:hypothetical protein
MSSSASVSRSSYVSGPPFVSFVLFAALVSFGSVLCFPSRLFAQPPDSIGSRAQGMAGAFTAVADDATATWWNPAGLASGAFLSALFEYGRSRPTGADDLAHRGFALGFPSLGLSYYRMTVSEIRATAATDPGAAGREQEGTPGVRAANVSQFGATIGQSLIGHLVLASTLKLIRADGETHGDLDIGAMAAFGLTRVGITVRNLREPTIHAEGDALTLRRQVRLGAALTSTARSSYGGATLAVDSDLRRVATAVGDERRLAVGGELWSARRTVGGRAGVSLSTVGERRTALTAGASVAVRPGFFVDGALIRGDDQLRRGWSAGLRVTF